MNANAIMLLIISTGNKSMRVCLWIIQPLSRVVHENPGGTNVSLLIARSMGIYANVTLYFQVISNFSVFFARTDTHIHTDGL